MKDMKFDKGKPRAGLLIHDFANALQSMAEVSTFGAEKYEPSSWRTVVGASERYKDALYRHMLAYEAGEINDEESGLPHLAHAAWNLLAILELTHD